ncbi:MAG: hypothetical protein ACREWJ_12865 [Rhodoferax sp.]
MKKLFLVALLSLSTGAMAQTSTASGSAMGNAQTITFPVNPSSITTTYEGSYAVKNVPSVQGPNLTTSNDTCMGSSSGGANGPGIGISFGSTWTDEQCKRLKMSRELWNKGMKAASLAMDCMDPAARKALEITGTMCPQDMTAEQRRAAFGPNVSVVGAVPDATQATQTSARAPTSSAVSRAVAQSTVTPVNLATSTPATQTATTSSSEVQGNVAPDSSASFDGADLTDPYVARRAIIDAALSKAGKQ